MSRFRHSLFTIFKECSAIHHVLKSFSNCTSLLLLNHHCLLSLLFDDFLLLIILADTSTALCVHELVGVVRKLYAQALFGKL